MFFPSRREVRQAKRTLRAAKRAHSTLAVLASLLAFLTVAAGFATGTVQKIWDKLEPPLAGAEGDTPSSSKKAIKGSAAAKAPGTLTATVSPLRDKRGLHRSIGVVPAGQRDNATRLIDQVRTAGRGPKTGYDRDEFGSAWTDSASSIAWAGNGCDTRNDILRRDLDRPQAREGTRGCVIVTGVLSPDPYTGHTARFTKEQASAIQIDHIFPLSFAWQMGAARWSDAKRKQLANDPLNLLAADGPQNASKGDSGPASWLPRYKPIRCAYAVRFAQVAVKYDLPVPKADKQAMRSQCA